MTKSLFAAALAAPIIISTGILGAGLAQAADYRSGDPAPVPADDDGYNGVRIGTLTCDVGGGVGYLLGSAKELHCTFRATNGRRESYTGVIRKLGVDLGFTTRGQLVWAVFAPTAGYHRGSLGGIYGGATVEATVGAGAGVNVLVGGTKGSVQLQTISVTGQIGLNVAATGTSMTLETN